MPVVAVSKEPRFPDDPRGRRATALQIPGARSSGDRSRKVLQSDVPSQENSGQALGDRLHFPGSGETDRMRFQRGLNLSKKGYLVTPSPSSPHHTRLTQCRGGTTEPEPQQKTPDDTRVGTEKSQRIFHLSQKGPRDQTQASQLAKYNVFNTFSEDPDREVCKLTKTARAPCRNRV